MSNLKHIISLLSEGITEPLGMKFDLEVDDAGMSLSIHEQLDNPPNYEHIHQVLVEQHVASAMMLLNFVNMGALEKDKVDCPELCSGTAMLMAKAINIIRNDLRKHNGSKLRLV